MVLKIDMYNYYIHVKNKKTDYNFNLGLLERSTISHCI